MNFVLSAVLLRIVESVRARETHMLKIMEMI
jgi:hypothetical protein